METLRQLMRKKSGILFSANRRKDDGILDEATAMFTESGKLEEQIARLLENDLQQPENAVIHWVSAASCYMNAGDFSKAEELFEFILSKDIRPRLRRDVKKFKKRCKLKSRN